MTGIISSNDLVIQVRKIEKTVKTHPYVADAVVIPLNTPSGEQKLQAYVEPGNPPPSAQSIIDYLKNDWDGMQVPIDIIFKDIPRTASGKIIRQQLLES